MPSTTPFKRGDIVLVPFPFTDLSSSKRRPALIISPDSFNSANKDVVLVAITSQISSDPNAIILEEQDFIDGKLPKVSTMESLYAFPLTANYKKLKAETLGRAATR